MCVCVCVETWETELRPRKTETLLLRYVNWCWPFTVFCLSLLHLPFTIFWNFLQNYTSLLRTPTPMHVFFLDASFFVFFFFNEFWVQNFIHHVWISEILEKIEWKVLFFFIFKYNFSNFVIFYQNISNFFFFMCVDINKTKI